MPQRKLASHGSMATPCWSGLLAVAEISRGAHAGAGFLVVIMVHGGPMLESVQRGHPVEKTHAGGVHGGLYPLAGIAHWNRARV